MNEYEIADKENKRLIAENTRLRTPLHYKFMRRQIVDADLDTLIEDNEKLREENAVYIGCKDWKESNAKMQLMRESKGS